MTLGGDLAVAHGAFIRLTVLQLLADQPSYCANDAVLLPALIAMGLPCTADQLRGHLTWLDEQRLLTGMELANGMNAVTLTERGGDVAAGRSLYQGVARPAPKGG